MTTTGEIMQLPRLDTQPKAFSGNRDQRAQTSFRGVLINVVCLIMPVAIYGLPALTISLLLNAVSFNPLLVRSTQLLSPLIYVVGFVLVAGALSRPAQKYIVSGTFNRKASDRVYGLRKIYGTCWTTVFYFKPLYHWVLTVPPLKKLVFRLFGYKGSMNFVVYPDSWIRDLPLLDLGENVYLANRCTIGTNMCVIDGTIAVDRIRIGEGSVIGHLAMIALGTQIGSRTEIGAGCAIATNTKIGNRTTLGAQVGVSHYATIGNGVHVGHHSFIGAAAIIGDNIRVPNGCLIPDRARIREQQDVYKYVSSSFRAGGMNG